jgi:hypothetical protein
VTSVRSWNLELGIGARGFGPAFYRSRARCLSPPLLRTGGTEAKPQQAPPAPGFRVCGSRKIGCDLTWISYVFDIFSLSRCSR